MIKLGSALCLLVSAALALPGGHFGGHGGIIFGGGGGHGGAFFGGGGHGGGYGGGYGGGGYGSYSRPTPYAFNYGVSAGNTNFGHSERGNGYGSVNGGYWVHLPDGRVQRVSYFADGSGFHPVVTYSGKAHYPGGYSHGYR